jgi:adenylyl cyclase-associated protein
MLNSQNFDTYKLTLLCRLEAATSRLEDMVPNYGDISGAANGGLKSPDLGTGAAAGADQTRGNSPPEGIVEPLPPAIEDFDAIVNGVVQTFVNMSDDIGGLVAEQVKYSQPSCHK